MVWITTPVVVTKITNINSWKCSPLYPVLRLETFNCRNEKKKHSFAWRSTLRKHY